MQTCGLYYIQTKDLSMHILYLPILKLPCTQTGETEMDCELRVAIFEYIEKQKFKLRATVVNLLV